MKNIDEMTGKELDQAKTEFEKVGIAPTGWRKMRVADKMGWLKANLPTFRKKAVPTGEKEVWAKRKADYYALKAQYRTAPVVIDGFIVEKGSTGAFVNKPRAVQFLAGLTRAAPPDPMTRQHRRHATRAGLKAILHETKMGALRDKRKGGAAAITSVMQS